MPRQLQLKGEDRAAVERAAEADRVALDQMKDRLTHGPIHARRSFGRRAAEIPPCRGKFAELRRGREDPDAHPDRLDQGRSATTCGGQTSSASSPSLC